MEAKICMTACPDAPDGQAHLTIQAAADELIRLEVVGYISDSTVCNVMKNVLYPWAEKIILITDNLNIHTTASPIIKYLRQMKRADWQNGLNGIILQDIRRRLNMAEIEIGIMSRQAPAKPQPDIEIFEGQIHIWTAKQNAECKKISWQFKTSDA